MDLHELPKPSFAGREVPAIPPNLIRDLRAEPSYAFETIARAAVDVHGPAAAKWVAEKQKVGYSPDQLARSAVKANANLARVEGAVLGIGGFITAVPDMAVFAWILARDVIFVSAAYGYDPTDPRRAAEVLVVTGVYDTVEHAQDALDKQGERLAVALARNQIEQVTTSSGPQRSVGNKLARFAAKRAARRFGGRMIPGLGAVLGAIDHGQTARRIGLQAIDFYRPKS